MYCGYLDPPPTQSEPYISIIETQVRPVSFIFLKIAVFRKFWFKFETLDICRIVLFRYISAIQTRESSPPIP